MPSDTAIASALATIIDGGSYSKTPAVSYSFDDLSEADEVSGPEVRISPLAETDNRISRNAWQTDAEIQITIVGPQLLVENETENTSEVAAWLTFAKEIKDAVKSAEPSGEPCFAITELFRFDQEALRDSNLFRTSFTATYRNI